MKTTGQRVKKEISEKLNVKVDVIDNKSSLECLGAEEIDFLEILMKIENEFDIEINDDDFFSCNTVGAIVALVETITKGK